MFDSSFLFLALIFLASNAVEAITGFGSTIIAVTLGANFYPIERLVPVLVPANLVLSAYIVVRHRSAIERETLFRGILPYAGAGLVIGMLIFNFVESRTLKLGYGIFVLFFSAYELSRVIRTKDGEKQPELSRLKAALWLTCGGIIQGIYASGGPLVVYYASRKITNKLNFRSTLSCLWLILNLFLLASHVAAGKTNLETLKMSAMLLPSVAVGIVVGEAMHSRIQERAFRIFVFALLVIAGASLVLKA